ncbi:exonuclease domain-containing protein [Paramicrobacterium agarici]|uniref:DNA polymerase-3 subunit epsilon n=1 Tax=Paramicrobacterium agarici TaxID=630514 RepID=A0A2A9DZC1_9MICO|nr:exonuclease domain-containing protein [Microbacterium agarici]PFG32038.1 DNA polymerase-3 subunit epsilon [Microbacterium agarici]
MGYAVVDFETTGILPSYHHRVIEIGVVHVESDGTVSGRWETVVNPQRDLGSQSIHGIRASDVLDAPDFADIVPELAGLLQGRVFVAHNVNFDLRFLQAEFERAGYLLHPQIPSLCTMRLAHSFGLGGSASLAAACESFGIPLGSAHRAGDDAFAAAQLLAVYRRESAMWPDWNQFWADWERSGGAYSYPMLPTKGVLWQQRKGPVEPQSSFLNRLSARLDRDVEPGAESEYLALLDRCLLDRSISVSEAGMLVALADEIGLDRRAAEVLHVGYVDDLVSAAWMDGIVTEAERRELEKVARALEIPVEAVADALATPPAAVATPMTAPLPAMEAFALCPEDMVVLTGEMSRPRSEWSAIIESRGFKTHPNVTKKVSLVAAADPDSLSGKAKKAREYSIPIVDEAGLARLVGL